MNHKKIFAISILAFLSCYLIAQDALNIDENGNVVIEKDLEVKGAATNTSTLTVNGELTAKSPVNVEKTLTVTEGVTAKSTLNVTGDTTVKKVNAENIDASGTIKNTTTNTTYDPLPVGTILMFNGSNWIDNETMIGWYQCNGANGTPNLIDKFIMGASRSGQEGGENETTEIITHSHEATATTRPAFTPKGTAVSAGEHNHSINNVESKSGDQSGKTGSSSGSRQHPTNTGMAGKHSHDLKIDQVPAYTPKVTVQSAGDVPSLDNRPAFYTVIFIMKVR